jgi:hypothetical protein
MIIVESRDRVKSAKRKLKKQLKNFGITLITLASHQDCRHHYQTVKAAFSADSYYWNQDLVNLAERLIEERKGKNPETVK